MAEKPTYEELEERIQELEKAEQKREQTELALQRRLAFEQLVKEISSEFARIRSSSSIDSAIDRALSSVGTFTGADRAYIFSFRNDDTRVDNTHEWCAEGIEPQIDHLKGIQIDERLPWFSKHIRNHEVFHVPDVGALPHDALLERKHFEAQNIQSLIVVPMETKEQLIGFLGFDAVSRHRNWGEEDRTILQFFAQTLGRVIDRKHAEAALRESEAFLQTLIDAIPTPVFYKDRNGKYVGFNKAFETFFGKKREVIIGKSVFEMNPPELAEIYFAKDEALFNNGGLQRYESQWENAHGELRDFIFNKAVFTDSKGVITGLIGILTDITERKRTEAALFESEEKFRLISEQSLMAIVIAQDDRIQYANRAYLEMTGYTWEEIANWTMRDVAQTIHPDDITFVMEQGRKKTAGITDGVVTHYAYRGFTKRGEIRWIDQYSKTITYREKPANLMTFIDITERKEVEAQLHRAQKLEAMGLLAGGVAHDLNNILSGIISYPELLLIDLPEDSPLRKPIQTIQESGMRAADVVADLLTITRGVATGKDVLNINTVVTQYLGSPEFHNLRETQMYTNIQTELAPNLLNIRGSLTHIKKTLMNLVTNASESIEGSGIVTISTHNRYLDEPLKGYENVRQGEYAVLSVSDDGRGISPKDLERIFEPFYTKKVMGRSGTGLGLAIVWNTVQDHKGYINVGSSQKGTTFELYFPVVREEVSTLKEHTPLEDYLGHGERILVVDDVEEQREIACRMLARLGYTADAVSSGEEAVEFVKEHSLDLIVLDMIMPNGINGLETFEAIVKIRPGQKAIIASGYARTRDVETAQTLGAGTYIKKPYTLEKLGLAVKEALEKIA
ncbi:MAG: PAS domain S-box protein [Deltaproteobacteria bacterium]|nr:PAS domain S-box protein [Deltaproteobacteria bacterium]